MRNTTMHAALFMTLGLGLLAAPALAAPTTAPSGGAPNAKFEGDVSMQITTDRSNGPQAVTAHIKGNQVRYDLPPSSNKENQPMQAIVDTTKKQVTLVMPEQKTYAVLDMNTIPPQSRQATANRISGAAASWKAMPTGVSKSMAGHDCNEWKAIDTKSNVKIDACLAPSVRIDFDKLLPSSMLPTSWADKLRNGELPLSATVYSADGKQTFDSEVTAVNPRTLPASDFMAPANYKRVTLPLSAFGDLLPSR